MAAFTSKASGNWSSGGQTTWNEVGVPGAGDTVSIGAHTVTVDVDTVVGTSPNDTTTKAITHTAIGTLRVAAGVTLTVRGSYQMVHDAVLNLKAGASFVFDNALSGGSPVYAVTNGGFSNYTFEGSVSARCSFGAIVGQTCAIGGAAWGTVVMSYTNLNRISTFNPSTVLATASLTEVTLTGCTQMSLQAAGTAVTLILRGVRCVGGTHATHDANIGFNGTLISGTREMSRCVFQKAVTFNTFSLACFRNYFGNGFDTVGGAGGASFTQFRENFVKQDGQRNSGNGQIVPSSARRNYFVVESATGNPHFVAGQALQGADTVLAQNVFESRGADLLDVGDCILMLGTSTSGGRAVIGRNNIVLPSAAGVTSGCLLTLYDPASTVRTEWYRNTANVNDTTLPISPPAMVSMAEANTGAAGQVQAMRSNLAWAASAGLAAFMARRLTGNVKDIITPASADRNWRHNVSDGDNQRGYEDALAANTLWTAGDAVAAGVDANGGSVDPNFYDSTRNIATWSAAIGGAGTYAAALEALQADPALVRQLLVHVFEGFRVRAAALRNAAHDGGAVGAANYIRPGRSLGTVSSLGAYLQAKYTIEGSSVDTDVPVSLAATVAVVRGLQVTVGVRA